MEVTAITRRHDAILTSIISQVTPSESSLIKRVAMEPALLRALRDGLGLKCVTRVSLHEPLTNIRKLVILHIASGTDRTEVWRALYGVVGQHRAIGKYVIAVNEDIDPENMDAIWWALSYRCNPALDMEVLRHRDQGHGPRSARNGGEDASVLWDATLKEAFPPISLPKREYMEKARVIWEELGLPALRPQAPWFGYSLGHWGEELEAMAARAVAGEHWTTGDIIAQRRRRDVTMNTEIED
jgi:4-hydroxy-3-polyprenylbenzoate decarboxylase